MGEGYFVCGCEDSANQRRKACRLEQELVDLRAQLAAAEAQILTSQAAAAEHNTVIIGLRKELAECQRAFSVMERSQWDAQAKRIAALEKVVEAARKINQDAWGLDEYDGYGIDDQDFVDLDTSLIQLDDALGGAE